MHDIPSLTSRLRVRPDGVWESDRIGPVSHPDEFQQWYLAVEETSYWFQHRAACMVECLKLFPPEGPVLDVGGGNGHVSLEMKRAGFDVMLLEPSAQGVANAQRRGISPILCTTLEDSGLKANSFPATGLFDVLEHVDDDRAFLDLIHHVLTPNGILLLTVPAFQILWSRHDERVGHFRRYTLGGLAKLLGQCGFAIEFQSYLFAPLVLPIFLLRAIPARLGLARRDELDHFRREHSMPGGVGDRIMRQLLLQEQKRIRRQKPIPLGSSCLVVARAVKNAESSRLRAA
jgi:SAM-dependent methyltransferase